MFSLTCQTSVNIRWRVRIPTTNLSTGNKKNSLQMKWIEVESKLKSHYSSHTLCSSVTNSFYMCMSNKYWLVQYNCLASNQGHQIPKLRNFNCKQRDPTIPSPLKLLITHCNIYSEQSPFVLELNSLFTHYFTVMPVLAHSLHWLLGYFVTLPMHLIVLIMR
jgi:hypothetical protein